MSRAKLIHIWLVLGLIHGLQGAATNSLADADSDSGMEVEDSGFMIEQSPASSSFSLDDDLKKGKVVVRDLNTQSLAGVKTVANPETITRFYASHTKIGAIIPGQLNLFTALRKLDLGFNKHLVIIHPDALQGLVHLEKLWVDNCGLTSLSFVHDLPSLVKVGAWSNKIADLGANYFKDCPKLAKIYLAENPLTTYSIDVFSSAALQKVSLPKSNLFDGLLIQSIHQKNPDVKVIFCEDAEDDSDYSGSDSHFSGLDSGSSSLDSDSSLD